MQNRFTVKDFLFLVIGLVICGLIWLNILKTNNEVVALRGMEDALKNQTAVMNKLESTVASQPAGAAIDAETLARLLEQGSAAADSQPTSEGERPENLATVPSYQPGYDIRFGLPTQSVNRRGLPQQWITAPDAELPADFAPGDAIVVSWATEPQTLTPMVATDQYARLIHWEVLETLVTFDLDAPFPYLPGLARSWEVSDDGLTLTFHLFENATWSDGQPVTADDVIFSWDIAMNEQIEGTARLRSYIEDNVASWEKVDTHTIRFAMKQPYYDAVGVCGNLLFIIPRHIYGDYNEDQFSKEISDVCVGSGPFVLDHWDRTREIALVRNENYWGPKPAVERITYRINTNELSNVQDFWAGNVDVVFRPSGEQFAEHADTERMRERGRGVLYYSPLNGYGYIGYNLRLPCFADKRTRQALTMLINRREIIDTLLSGQGREISGPFFYGSDQYDRSIEPWPYDPERAKALLAEVGWEDTDGDGVIDMDLNGDGVREPFEVTYLTASGQKFAVDMQRYVQEAFKEAGIRVNLDLLEWTIFLERVHERQFDIVAMSWSGSPESDPFQIFHSSSEPNRGSNHIGFNNAEADALMERGRTTLDYQERMKIWHEFHRLLHEEQPVTFVYGRAERFFIDKRFKNVVEHDYRPFYAEWYVPAQDQLR